VTLDQRSEDSMTAQSLKDRVAKRLKATGQPKRRSYANLKPFRSSYRAPDYETGRPSLYRPEYCKRAIEFMGMGFSVTALAGELGVAKDTIYEWISVHAEFSAAIRKARAARVAALETKLLTTSQGVGVTAAIFALKNADPDEWQDRYNTESTVNVRIERIPDHELMRIASTARSPLLIEGEVNPDLGTELGTDRKR
jgi:hypothetical protein